MARFKALNKNDFFLFWGTILVFLILALFLNIESGNISIDDSFIFFRYAKNISNGEGIVYNPGGERVEGFTSFLWMAILALFYKLGINIDILARLFGCIIGVVNLIFVQKICKFLQIKYLLSLLAITLNLGFMIWNCATGMDFALYSLLLTIFYYSFIKKSKNLLLLSSILLSLCRPEGLVYVFVGFGFLFLENLKKRDEQKKNIIIIMMFSMAIGIYFILKYLYFGFFLPNTYYAKVGGFSIQSILNGCLYIFRFFSHYWIIWFFVIFLLWDYLKAFKNKKFKEKKFSREILFLMIILLSNMTIYTLTGGDHFASYRQIQVCYPLLAIVFSLGFFEFVKKYSDYRNKKSFSNQAEIKVLIFLSILNICIYFVIYFLSKGKTFFISLNQHYGMTYIVTTSVIALSAMALSRNKIIEKKKVALVLIVFLFLAVIYKKPYLIDHEFEISRQGKIFGQYIDENFPQNVKIAVYTAGALPYYANRYCIDTLGLNDVRIAHASKGKTFYANVKNHAAFNKEMFFYYKPDLFIVEIKSFTELIFNNLFNDENFKKNYQYVTSEIKGTKLSAFVHKDFEWTSLLE